MIYKIDNSEVVEKLQNEIRELEADNICLKQQVKNLKSENKTINDTYQRLLQSKDKPWEVLFVEKEKALIALDKLKEQLNNE